MVFSSRRRPLGAVSWTSWTRRRTDGSREWSRSNKEGQERPEPASNCQWSDPSLPPPIPPSPPNPLHPTPDPPSLKLPSQPHAAAGPKGRQIIALIPLIRPHISPGMILPHNCIRPAASFSEEKKRRKKRGGVWGVLRRNEAEQDITMSSRRGERVSAIRWQWVRRGELRSC